MARDEDSSWKFVAATLTKPGIVQTLLVAEMKLVGASHRSDKNWSRRRAKR